MRCLLVIALSLLCVSILTAGTPQKIDLSVRMFYPGVQNAHRSFVESSTLVFKEIRLGPQTVFRAGLRPMYLQDTNFRFPQNVRFHGIWFTVSFSF